MERVTLEDVAREAGVSRNTVSCALRNSGRVAAATRKRILALAEAMRYRPDPLVSAHMQNLRSRQKHQTQINLAFLHAFDAPDAWQKLDFCLQLYGGAREHAEKLGFELDAVWARQPGLGPERLGSILRARGVQGVLAAPLPLGQHRLPLDWGQFAGAALGFSLTEPALHRAGTHQIHSILTALQELDHLGYHRLGVLVSPSSDRQVDFAWTAGLAMASRFRPARKALKCLRTETPIPAQIDAWLRKYSLDAVVNAGVAGLGDALQSLNRRVPEDIGLVSLLGSPPTATVLRDWETIGAAAIDLIVGQLFRNERGVPLKPKTVLIEGTWRPGSTVRYQP